MTMGTLTIRNLPDETIDRIKAVAKARGWSMEQEIRSLIEARYADRKLAIERIRKRRAEPGYGVSADQIDEWIAQGR